METGKLAYAGDTTAGFTSRSGGTPPATTARSHVSTRSGAGRSEAGMSHLGTGAVAAPLGTFLGTEASDDAKAMWSAYRSQLHSRVVGDGPPSLGLMSSTAGGMGQRLKRAPNMPKLGGPDDPGRLVKDWQYYCYHPKGTLHSSLNQYGTSMNSRWCATATPSSGRAAPPLRPTACTAYLPSTQSVHRTSRALHLAAATVPLTACIPRVLQARPQPHPRDEASPGAYASPEPGPEPGPEPEPEPEA